MDEEEKKCAVRPRGTDSARVIQVIETKSLQGSGLEGDPCRELVQYWDFDGNLLACKDTMDYEKQEDGQS